MSENHRRLLGRYLQLPDKLESAVAGLSNTELDLSLAQGWSIRVYVHHVVEGELMWQLYLRAILGRDGIEFPIQWYFGLPQDEWVKQWVYQKRAVDPTLSLFRASTSALTELLENIAPEAWRHSGRVTWPGAEKETRLSVRDIVLMHLRHSDQHIADIRQIREQLCN